jgi:hypothetical protein
MYVIIIHSKYKGKGMKKDTNRTSKERLNKAVDTLTEENQRHFLGILEALVFAQSEQDKGKEEKDKELPVYPV